MKKWRLVSVIAMLIILSSCSTQRSNDYVYTGTVEADEADISSEISGVVKKTNIDEGDIVKEGDILMEIDVEGLKLEAKQVEAALKIAEANFQKISTGARYEELKTAQTMVEQNKSNVEAKEKDYEYNLDKYNQTKKLWEESAVPEQNVKDIKAILDASEQVLQGAKKQLDSAQYQLELLEKGSRTEDIKIAGAEVERAKAALESINYKISKQYIKIPLDGVVQRIFYDNGELVPMNAKVADLINLEEKWVKIFVPEKQLNKVSVGQELTLKADYLGEKSLVGKVSYISTEAEFTPRNIESKEDKQEMVFAVKVKLPINIRELKPGMLVDVILGGSSNGQ